MRCAARHDRSWTLSAPYRAMGIPPYQVDQRPFHVTKDGNENR